MGQQVMGLESGCTKKGTFSTFCTHTHTAGCHEHGEGVGEILKRFLSEQVGSKYPESKIQDLPQKAESYDTLQGGIAFLVYRTTRCGVNFIYFFLD